MLYSSGSLTNVLYEKSAEKEGRLIFIKESVGYDIEGYLYT